MNYNDCSTPCPLPSHPPSKSFRKSRGTFYLLPKGSRKKKLIVMDMSTTFLPPTPVRQTRVFANTEKICNFFICLSIDSELSKTYDYERNNAK